MIIVNKSTQNIVFRTKAGKILIKGDGILNDIPDNVWAVLYGEYKGFFDKRRFSDKNPAGVFVYNDRKADVEAESAEADFTEWKDGGKQLTIDEALETEFSSMTVKQLSAYADANGIEYRKNCRKQELLNQIYSAEKNKDDNK